MQKKRNYVMFAIFTVLLVGIFVVTGCSNKNNSENQDTTDNSATTTGVVSDEIEMIEGEPDFDEQAITTHIISNTSISVKYPTEAESWEITEAESTSSVIVLNVAMLPGMGIHSEPTACVEILKTQDEFGEQQVTSIGEYINKTCISGLKFVNPIQVNGKNGYKFACHPDKDFISRMSTIYLFEKDERLIKIDAGIESTSFTDKHEKFLTEFIKGFSF